MNINNSSCYVDNDDNDGDDNDEEKIANIINA